MAYSRLHSLRLMYQCLSYPGISDRSKQSAASENQRPASFMLCPGHRRTCRSSCTQLSAAINAVTADSFAVSDAAANHSAFTGSPVSAMRTAMVSARTAAAIGAISASFRKTANCYADRATIRSKRRILQSAP